MGVKMVLSGEGSDEILGGSAYPFRLVCVDELLIRWWLGYLYFHAAPDSKSFHQECVKRVKNLHTSDCLRANKYELSSSYFPLTTLFSHSIPYVYRSTMAWGLEARVPFLDKAFLEVAMNIDPKEKQFSKGTSQETDQDGCPKMEKYILRKAFDVSPDGKVKKSCPPPQISFFCFSKSIILAVPPSIDPLASERTVLRRGRIFLDRRSQGTGGKIHLRREFRTSF